VFLLFGVFARRGAEAGLRADPVPQALVITGIVVAFSATALAVALLIRLNKDTGEVVIASDPSAESGKQGVRQ
jgi:multicomponent Na+:H+ antiporter subunit C